MQTLATNHPIHVDLLQRDRHYAALVERKQVVEERLAEEMAHSAVDWEDVKALKLKKLKLNEQLQAYMHAKAAVH